MTALTGILVATFGLRLTIFAPRRGCDWDG
jgi:hypothetical protein